MRPCWNDERFCLFVFGGRSSLVGDPLRSDLWMMYHDESFNVPAVLMNEHAARPGLRPAKQAAPTWILLGGASHRQLQKPIEAAASAELSWPQPRHSTTVWVEKSTVWVFGGQLSDRVQEFGAVVSEMAPMFASDLWRLELPNHVDDDGIASFREHATPDIQPVYTGEHIAETYASGGQGAQHNQPFPAQIMHHERISTRLTPALSLVAGNVTALKVAALTTGSAAPSARAGAATWQVNFVDP